MNIRKLFLVAQFFFFVLALYCCDRPAEVSQPLEVQESEYSRQHIGTVVFNRWPDDYILLTSVLRRAGDTCQFAPPIRKEDPSLYVGPLQSVWVLHDKEKASDQKVISDVFYKGDALSIDGLPQGPVPPLAFRSLSSFHKKSIKVELGDQELTVLRLKLTVDTSVVKTSENESDDMNVYATGGKLIANVIARPVLQGNTCVVESKYCVEGQSCDLDEFDYDSFSRLNVNLTSSFIPKIDYVVIH